MHPNVEASIADLRAIAMAHPELSDELHDVIGQLRDTECRSISPEQARMALAWREACLCGRYDDEPPEERAFADHLLRIDWGTEQESEDQGGSGGA